MQSLAQEWVVAEQALIVLELRSSHRARSRHLIVHVRLEQTFRHRHLSLARLIIEAHVPGVGIMSSDFSEVAHCSAAGQSFASIISLFIPCNLAFQLATTRTGMA